MIPLFRLPLRCLLTATASFGSMAMVGCGSSTPGEENASERSFLVETAVSRVMDWPEWAEAVGTILPSEEIMVRNTVDGILQRINVREGEPVYQGESLFALDPELYEIDLRAAEAVFAQRESDYQRAGRLFADRHISEADLVAARSARDAAEASRDASARRLRDTRIAAPFTGVVGLRRVSVGDWVGVGTPLLPLMQIDPLHLEFRLPEHYFSRVRPGQRVVFTSDALSGEQFEGVVDVIEPALDPVTRTLRIRAKVPNPNFRLAPHLTARIRLELGELSDVVVIPEEALVSELGGFFVYQVDEDNRARLTPVRPGERRNNSIVLLEGLSGGETIVQAGHQRLFDGVLVSTGRNREPDSQE